MKKYCEFTLEAHDSIVQLMFNLIEEYRESPNGSLIDLSNRIYEEANKLRKDIYGSEAIPQIAQAISEGILDWAEFEDTKPYLIDTIESKLRIAESNKKITTVKSSDLNDIIINTQEAEEAEMVSSEFLINAYGSATDVKEKMILKNKIHLFDALFVNRGSIKNGKRGILTNTEELHRNIREYQTMLLTDICNYFRKLAEDNPNMFNEELLKIINNPVLFEYKDGKYVVTNALQILLPIIEKTIAPKDSNYKPYMLHNLLKNENYLVLDAYAANIMLKHFDSFLTLYLKDVININPTEFNRITGSSDKYNISKQTANLYGTWRTSSDIDPGKELDFVTKLLVDTTPVLNYGEIPGFDSDILSRRFLTWANYQNIIGKIKLLGNSSEAKKLIFNEEFQEKYSSYYDLLSEETKNYINGKSLAEVINILMRNDRQYLHYIFEVLANPMFQTSDLSYIFDAARIRTKEEINHLYSAYHYFFNPNNPNSLRNLVGILQNNDYYNNLTQASRSIFQKPFVQLYLDENGILKVRLLSANELEKIKRNITTSINRRNSIRFPLDVAKYSIRQVKDEVVFIIPNTGIKVTVDLLTGKCEFSDEDALYDNDDVINFLDDILGLNIKYNADFLPTFESNYTTSDLATKALVTLASHVLAVRHVSETNLKDLDKTSARAKAIDILGEKVAFNNNSGQINAVILNLTNDHTLRQLANTRYVLNGLAVSTQVKNGQNNQLSEQGLEHLIPAATSQQYLVEMLKDELDISGRLIKRGSITRNLTIIKNPNIFKGHYTTSEYYDGKTKKVKPATKFSVGEMAYSLLVSNFFPALFGEGKTHDVIKKGIVSFLASVNSDKPTIGQVAFDLNETVKINGELIAIKDLNPILIKELINLDFGHLYSELYETIKFDFERLRDYIIDDLIRRLKEAGNNSTRELYSFFEIDYLNNFEKFNDLVQRSLKSSEILQEIGKTPVEFIKYYVQKYNQEHLFNPIELIDQIHFRENKNGTLSNNPVLLGYIARYNPTKAIELGLDLNNYPTLDEYIDSKLREYLSDALENKLKINLSNEENNSFNTIRKKYPEWVNDSKNLILAKIKIDGKSYNITSTIDLNLITAETGLDPNNIISLAEEVTLMPLIELHNLLDYWLTQQWMDTTVGTLLAHPEKGVELLSIDDDSNIKYFRQQIEKIKSLLTLDLWNNNRPEANKLYATLKRFEAQLENKIKELTPIINKQNIIRREAAMFQALHKRNVSFTAQKHSFSLNTLNGISEDYNISVIEDIEDIRPILSSFGSKIKPYDGATIVNPFMVLLENTSLRGAQAGTDKKQFVHFKKPDTATAGIIKTAGFGLTNDRMRLCKSSTGYDGLMRQMTDNNWIDENGNIIKEINILQGFNDLIIHYGDNSGNIYFAKNGRRFRFNSSEIIYNGNNTYSRIIYEVNSDGSDNHQLTNEEAQLAGIETISVIDTNYKLWNFFGGAYSLELRGEKLVFSESSILNVVTAMNSIGVRRINLYTGQQYSLDQIETQDQLWQPLKHSDIHYLVTQGAIKQNAANINLKKKYSPNGGKLDFQRIKLYYAGILLDKEHHADDADLSLPSLILSAATELGYTFDEADFLYQSLANATRLGIKDYLNSAKDIVIGDQRRRSSYEQELLKQTLDLVSKELASGEASGNFAKIIAKNIRKAVEEGNTDILENASFPLSDNTVFNQMISTITSYINKSGIKLKIKGILSVLVPSHNLYMIYGDRKYDSFMFWNERVKDRKLVEEEFIPAVTNGQYSFYDGITHRIMTIEDFNNLPHDEKFLHALQWKSNQNPLYKAERLSYNLQKEVDEVENYIDVLNIDNVNRIYDIKLGRNYKVNYDLTYQQDQTKFGNYDISYVSKGTILSNIDGLPVGMSNPHTGIIKVDLETMREKFIQKAWRYSRNSEPLNYDFTTFEEFMAFALTHEVMHDKFKIRPGEARYNYETRINNEALKLIQESKNPIKEIYNPKLYRNLKQDIKLGLVTEVSEYIIDGRNLGAYNAIFETQEGEKFQLWDLDNIYYLQSINELQNDEEARNWYFDTFGLTTKQTLNELRKTFQNRVQEDLCNLSKRVEDKPKQLNLLYQNIRNLDAERKKFGNEKKSTSGITRKLNEVVNKYRNYINANLNINITSVEEIDQRHLEFINALNNLLTVSIDGIKYHPIKESIQEEAYEIVMSKVYLNEFGFDEYTDLNKVKSDELWFVRRAIDSLKTSLVADKQYDVELKYLNGNHIYILDRSHLTSDSELNLYTASDLIDKRKDKWYQLDSDGKLLFEVPIGTEIYTDAQGHRVYVVNSRQDISTLINNVPKFDFLSISDNIKNYNDYAEKLIIDLDNYGNKHVKLFIKELTDLDKYDTQIILNYFDNSILKLLNNDDFEKIFLDYKMSHNGRDHWIIRQGKIKHSSFLKSLDIIAARIPSLSMSSFMSMKIVAYDNPNINSAYVSTLLLLLQGSDYDIDSVSLVMYNINKNGVLEIWSPYSNLESILNLEASMTLPFPSGEEILLQETDDLSNIVEFFHEFSDLFNIDYSKKTEKLYLNLNKLDNPDRIKLLGKLLRYTTILKPNSEIREQLKHDITILPSISLNLFDLSIKLSEEDITSIFDSIKKIIDEHNLYLNEIPTNTVKNIQNNLIVYSLYNIISDISNQLSAQAPIDAVTEPLKQIGNKSSKALKLLVMSPGNEINRYISIFLNQIAKECVGISAVGIKGYFMMYLYALLLLNKGTALDQERLFSIATLPNTNIKTIVANIRAKNPATVTNREALEAILSIRNEEDQSLVLSALLSLSVDNAKELLLDKLNAGAKTISLYIYAVAAGMKILDISRLIMSKTAQLLADLCNENVMFGEISYNKISDALEYFKEVPYRILAKYTISVGLVAKALELDKKGFGKEFIKFLNNNNSTEAIKKLEKLRTDIEVSPKYKTELNLLIDFLEEYAYQYKNTYSEDLKMIAYLSKGADEMFIIGLVAGLNKGLPTQLPKLLNLISYIEDALINEKNKEYSEIIDLLRFAFDDKYRKYCYEKFEKLNKHTINYLEMLDKVPHLLAYVQALATADAMCKKSWRYRMIRENFRLAKSKFKGSADDIIKGLNKLLGDDLLANWMIDRNISVIIPKGNKIYDPTLGTLSSSSLKESIRINLGPDANNATFRKWVEEEVIPNLKKGNLGKTDNISAVENNTFILELNPIEILDPVSGNAIEVYGLNINMLPRTDSEKSLFNSLKDSFNELEAYNYEIETEINGKKVTQSINLVDLFSLYALITYEGSLSESSLISIFEDIQFKGTGTSRTNGQLPNGIFNDFHNYVSQIDKFEEAKILSTTKMVPYLASKAGPYFAYLDYTWGFNEESGTRLLMYKNPSSRKNTDPNSDDIQEEGIGKYVWSSISNYDLDVNMFPKTINDQRLRIDYINSDDYLTQYEVIWNPSTDKVEVKEHNEFGNHIKTFNADDVIIIKNGHKQINTRLIKKLIDREINPTKTCE